jgi:sortase A
VVPPTRWGTDGTLTRVASGGKGDRGVPGRPAPIHYRPHRVFDREEQPHDWRWIVGGIGKVLIVTGLLMFAFVAYQLWGTGIYTAQAQHRLDHDFDQLGVPPTASVTTTNAPVATTTTVFGTTGPFPSNTPPTSLAVAGAGLVPYPFASPQAGKALVRLQIPDIDVDYKVVEGVGLDELAKGPGHFPESVLPGQLGNTAIAGHRTTHGAPFYDVDHLGPGEQIIVTYPKIGDLDGPRFVYLVTGTEIVSPDDYAKVVPTTDPTTSTLILASCHPIRSAAKRIIIRAELDPTQSSPLFAPTPLGAAGGSTIPGDDDGQATTVAPGASDAGATTPASTVSGGDAATSVPATTPAAVPATTPAAVPAMTSAATRATTSATTSVTTPASTPTSTGVTAPVVVANAPAASQDAFAGGWFDDSAAWPHIILWGLLLALITYGGYLLAKRQRRIWLGTLAAFVPFVLVLYFWFENINRLLPPGL